MVEVIVYVLPDYSKSESILVKSSLSKKEITEIVNKTFVVWYYYDIMSKNFN